MADLREERITFMNSLAHAVNIMIHNSNGQPVDTKEVIELAKKITLISLNPSIEKFAETIKKGK